MALFHVSGLLAPGSVISPGNWWGRIIKQIGWPHGRAVYEVALEDQRARSFPHVPSRFNASFFFDDVEEARFYKSIQNLHTRLLYEVELVDPAATKHQTDWRNISPEGFVNEMSEDSFLRSSAA